MNSEWNEMFGDTDKLSDDKSIVERSAAHLQMQARSSKVEETVCYTIKFCLSENIDLRSSVG